MIRQAQCAHIIAGDTFKCQSQQVSSIPRQQGATGSSHSDQDRSETADFPLPWAPLHQAPQQTQLFSHCVNLMTFSVHMSTREGCLVSLYSFRELRDGYSYGLNPCQESNHLSKQFIRSIRFRWKVECGEAFPGELKKVVNCFAMRKNGVCLALWRVVLCAGTHVIHFNAPNIHISDGGKCCWPYMYSLTSSLESKHQCLLQPRVVTSAGEKPYFR